VYVGDKMASVRSHFLSIWLFHIIFILVYKLDQWWVYFNHNTKRLWNM